MVMGTEVAGARSAIEAAKQGLRVIMVNKGIQGRGGVTQLAVYSCNAALGYQDERDSPEIHFRDTVRAGRFINNQRLVGLYTEQASREVLELETYGLRWTRKEGKISQGIMPGSSCPRSLHVGYRTGVHMVRALKAEVKRHPQIHTLNDLHLVKLLSCGDGTVIGALGLDLKDGSLIVLSAKATVVAAGSALYLYQFSSGTHEGTGDGYACAYEAGARLQDMEFVQFFPTGTAYPKSIEGTMGPCIQRYWLHAHLYNAEGERFMRRYAPKEMEKATRDILSRSIFAEITQGRGTLHNGVWLDCTHLAPNIIEAQVQKMFGGKWVWSGVDVLKFGLDPRVRAIEATPVPHYFMGGIQVDEACATCVEGLYAAGEAVAGMDGANRLAGNALSHCLVTGRIAGNSAALRARKGGGPESPDEGALEEDAKGIYALLDAEQGESPVRVRRLLQELMWRHVGVIRDGGELEAALERIRDLKTTRLKLSSRTRRYNKEWLEALQLRSLLLVAEMVTRSALRRKESRGAHFRTDFPDTDNDTFLKNICIQRAESGMTLSDEPVVITRLHPDQDESIE